MTLETVTNGTEALFIREGMPPVKEMIPCALQHVLASFAGIITPAVIMAGVYGFNSQQSTDIIQVALILSAIDTALQAFAPFRRIGGGLPIVMGVSFAFLPALQAMGASGFSFGALLGGEIVGGAVAVLFGLAYSKIKWLFPPVVTGTVIFSIGVSLSHGRQVHGRWYGHAAVGYPAGLVRRSYHLRRGLCARQLWQGHAQAGLRVLWHDRWHDRFDPLWHD